MLTQRPYTHNDLDRVIDLLLAYCGAGNVRNANYSKVYLYIYNSS